VTDKSTAQTVTIIGAGIGGLYLLAELGIAGFKLRLHDIDDSRLSEIRARGGVDVDGEKGGFAAVERATSDLGSTVDGADIIIVVTGGNAQACTSAPGRSGDPVDPGQRRRFTDRTPRARRCRLPGRC
jgi:threonine dehydrogenase-like Zn-dependent dehydrogenase